MNEQFTHLNAAGEARMVDVGDKRVTTRSALAAGRIVMQPQTLAAIRSQQAAKGDVLAVARIAAIMAAKRTAELIPLCHPLPLTKVEIEFELQAPAAVECRARVATLAPTGVEMEALTAVQVALLTIYDMCKAQDRAMSFQDVRLLSKTGGASGDWYRPAAD